MRSRGQSITVTIIVKDTRGNLVPQRVRLPPLDADRDVDAERRTDRRTTGRSRIRSSPESDFPIKNGYSVQFYVKAYKKGDPALAGISGTRLVQVATAK